jgi:hypothetical protein
LPAAAAAADFRLDILINLTTPHPMVGRCSIYFENIEIGPKTTHGPKKTKQSTQFICNSEKALAMGLSTTVHLSQWDE